VPEASEARTTFASPDEPAATITGATPVPVPDTGGGPLRIGDAFGRYTIMRLLGIGGMGAVYQAWDKELDVVVALKVIRPEVLKDPVAEQEIERRFKRELLLARQVTHKNVVRIHDLGEIRGIKYITMSYIHGTDLSTLRKRGRLPVPQILRIMRGVVSGLVAAHTAGVVHRDLKPGNIMIDADGEALIMDFGIARSIGGPADLSAATAAPRGGLPDGIPAASKYTEATMLGTIVGTVEYMAPEQALGQAIDQRADIYATGLMMYDLLTGVRRSEQPGTALDRLRARLERPMPPIKSLVPEVSDALAAIITRAIELDAGKRHQTTKELEADLARLDDQGVPLPVKRHVSLPMMAGVAALLLAVSSAVGYYFWPTGPEAPHDPVTVVISDLQNLTGDAAFDRTLEPMLRRALEGASFITAFDRNGLRRTVGTALPQKLDEAAARELAVKQGLGIVLSGTIEKRGSGYNVSMRAVQAHTGDVLSSVQSRASSQDQVLPTATKLATSVRKALGDKTTSQSEQIFSMNSLSATSLDVVRHYAAAIEAQTNAKFADARDSALKAVEADPKFGLGYLLLATVSRNLGRSQDADEYIKKAMSLVDGMTERERLATRGLFYRVTADYQKCVQEYRELIKRYAADLVGHNQLALCASKLRDLKTAQSEMQEVVKLVPNRAIFLDNVSLYSSYAGDFDTGEEYARKVQEPEPFSRLALGFAQMGKGQLPEAAATFTELARTAPDPAPDGPLTPVYGRQGPTLSAAALGDLAIHEGRFAEAVRILEQGAAADVAAKSTDGAASKYAALAYAQMLRGQKAAAIAAAEKSLSISGFPKIKFLAARTFIEAGQPAKAKPLATELSADLQPEPQAYGKILEGLALIAAKDARGAIKPMTEANALLDTWIGHFELGRAYLAANQFAQADSEFDTCIKRRGEALSLFLDEEPTFGYFPVVYYYLGRVREGLGSTGAADSYRTYLSLREKAGEDPLVSEIKKRIK